MLPSLTRIPLRALVVLLLAVLFVQAVPSQPISLERGRGPVFSAATAEVTLPPREDELAEVCTLAAPCPDPALLASSAAIPALPNLRHLSGQHWPAHPQTGPPLRPPPRSIASPREPPRLS